MSVFHSLPYAAILGLAQRVPSGIVPGDVYFSVDTLQLMVAATDSSLVPFNNLIMSGNITGTPGPCGRSIHRPRAAGSSRKRERQRHNPKRRLTTPRTSTIMKTELLCVTAGGKRA